MLETKRTTRNLLMAFAAVCVLGIAAAAVVMARTGSERITVAYEALIPSLVADDGQCFAPDKFAARDDDGVVNALIDCELRIPTSPQYPEAQSVWFVPDPTDIFALPRFAVWRCRPGGEAVDISLAMTGSASTLGLETLGDVVTQIQSPMTSFEMESPGSVLDRVCGPSWWSTTEIWWEAGANEALLDGQTLEIAVEVDADINPNAADSKIGWRYTKDPDRNGYVPSFEQQFQVIVTPDPAVEIVWVDTTIGEQMDTGQYPAFEPTQTRALSLPLIWGTTLGLLGLVGLVGAIVSRPLMGVAKRAESNRVEADLQRVEAEQQKDEAERLRVVAERNGTQLEHVLSATHHELSREIIQVGFVMDDLSDEGVDVQELKGSFDRLQEGRDSIAALAQLGGETSAGRTQTVAANDLVMLTDRMELRTSGGELEGVDRLLVRTLVKNAARLAEGSGCAALSVEVHGNALHLAASGGSGDAWERREAGAVSDHWGLIDQVVEAHEADVLVQGAAGGPTTMIVTFPAAAVPDTRELSDVHR